MLLGSSFSVDTRMYRFVRVRVRSCVMNRLVLGFEFSRVFFVLRGYPDVSAC
jgi:hypothetical protein